MAQAAKRLSKTVYFLLNSFIFGVFVLVASYVPTGFSDKSCNIAEADTIGDGSDGSDGTDGSDGSDGTDGYTQGTYYGQGTYYTQASYCFPDKYTSCGGDGYYQWDYGGDGSGCDSF